MKSIQKRVIIAILSIVAVIEILLLSSVAAFAGDILDENTIIFILIISIVLFAIAIIGGIFATRSIFRDLLAASEKLHNKVESADAANKAKSDFLANMSHEVRTPINAILGMNEMIIRESTDEQIVEYATNIKQAGRTLLAQVNGILDYSKLESGQMEVIPVEYDLAQMINGLVTSVSARAKSKGLNLETNIDTELPATLFGDDVRLSQIMANLLTNAIKYTEKGRVTLNISEKARFDNFIDLSISVEDTGIGIKKEDLKSLSVSFKRIEEERNRDIEGTGLGIPIVIKLLHLMDSELNVDSVYGEGSTFSFVIRQGIINNEPLGDYKKRIKKSYRRRNKYTYPSMPSAEILVVDDYDMNLVVAKNLMKVYDFIPDLAESGPEAITMAMSKEYDVIFMDHMMPGMDGVEALQVLNERGIISDKTSVIALTANAIAGAKEFYLSKGFKDYLTKPIESDELEDMLVKYVPKRKVVKKPISDIKHNRSLTTNDDERQALIKIFVSTIDDVAKKLDECLEAEDIKNYTIKVHGLKSTARLIGEMSISQKAEALEKAGNDNDWDYIRSHHKGLIKEYLSIRDSYEGKKSGKKTLEDGDLKDALYSIIEMANVCDYTSTEMVLNSLDEYEMPDDVAAKMKELRGLLEKLDYEAVSNIAKEML